MTVPTLVARVQPSNDSGPVLLLGPSLGSDDAILWEPVIPLLADRFRIVTWDLPGHGRSPKATEPFTLGEIAEGVVAILDELAVEKVYYAGISISGGVGLELALRHPERVAKTASVCSAAKFGTSESWLDRAALVRAESTSPLVVPSAQRWFAPGSIERHPDVTGRLLHSLQDADDESYALACDALAVFDLRPRLGEIAVPVLAVAGDVDPASPAEKLEEIAAGVPDGRYALIEDCSHLASVDQPDALAKLLTDFFA